MFSYCERVDSTKRTSRQTADSTKQTSRFCHQLQIQKGAAELLRVAGCHRLPLRVGEGQGGVSPGGADRHG